jgi:type IV pilus assembly protein PilQ
VIRLNFVVSDDVKGRVTMTLRDVPWDQALEIILKSKGIGYVREGNITRVAPEKVLAKEAEEDAKRQVAVKEAQPILLKIIPVNYSKAGDLQARVKDILSDKGSVSVDARTNRLIVRDVLQRIRAAERMVKKLDTQTPQVLIEARIVEANTTFSRDIGIQWGGDITLSPATGNPTGLVFPSTVGIAGGSPLGLSTAQGILNPAAPNFAVNLPAAVGPGAGGALGFTFGSIGGNVNLNLRISAAEENGQAKIISAPKITTMDNQRATIQQGVSIPISQSSALGVNTIFVDANLTLTVTPHVTLDGSVIMDIIATKNEPDFTRTGAQGDPTILRKEARTQVLIKDGETTVIGGIYTRNVNTNFREVPLFSRIPILGWLFKKKLESDSRTELLIFITPRIVNRPEALGT